MTDQPKDDRYYLARAVKVAKQGVAEGGYAVGAVLVKDGVVVGESANRNVQSGDPTDHAEIACLRAAPSEAIAGATLYTTLSPCIMCAGALVWLGVKRVVIGDSTAFSGNEEWLMQSGLEVIEANDPDSISLMKDHPMFSEED
ncbi:nucleoside deaminase [Shimia sp. SDUM112013]|uniref:nucleoside deaminase n=1 Tax=Shimia sp. SDUM112013 TaxID=3136160 RepID=UPI0032EB1447